MKSTHPRSAAWILERLGLDVALAGDLLEERARGRSALWYGRQLLIAMGMGIWGDIRDHKVLALRAVATGCAVNAVWTLLWLNFLHIGLPARPLMSAEAIASLLAILVTQTVTGWIVARTHRAHAIPMVLVFATWLVGWWVAGSFPEGKRLLVDSLDQARFRAYLAWYLTPISIEMTGLLLGGILGARPSKEASSPRMATPGAGR